MKQTFAVACFAVLIPIAHADQGGFANAGGTLSGGTSVANPPGTLTIGGGALTFLSSNGSIAINATFASSSTVESCAGGGRGGHVTCSFTFRGTFSGTLTLNGATQAINGSTYQLYGTNGVVVSGTTGYNSAYTPFYFSNTGQILRSDDLSGTNLITYGAQGGDVGQFYGAYGIAVDSAGRIYVADTYNSRIVRIDDMNGTNWTSFGAYGADVGQFNDPSGISIDPAGRIYVMDTGNNRLVRMDDMSGTNWTEMSGTGSGVGQFAQYVAAVAFDASGRIYLADTGNKRIVRMDDMSGTNWTTLTQSPVIGIYIYSFGSPIGVAVDASGRIYVADASLPSVIRVDDMTGANWTSISLGSGATPHSIAIDSSGMVLVGGGGAQIVDSMAGVLSSASALTQAYGPYYVFGATPVPVSSPPPSAINFSAASLTFAQNVGTSSAPQTVTIANFGGSPLNGLKVSTSGSGFSATNDCSSPLTPGSTCTISVWFTPVVAGTVTGSLTVNDDSGNLGPTQIVPLNGTGTAPAAALTPASLSFSSQAAGTVSTARTVSLQSAGTGPLQVSSITVTPPFSQTNNCNASLVPGASCTIAVSFAPTVVGSASGTVTIADNAGIQTVGLTGTASAPVSLSATSLSFGTLALGNTSSARTVTVTNRLNVTLNISGVTASGPFAVASNTCGSSLTPGAKCVVGVTFTPVALGSASGVLTIGDDAVTSPQTVTLSGTGSAPVTLSPGSLSFNSVAVGNTSSAKTVTVTNRQNVALNIAEIAASAEFAVASTTCGASLAAGASCTVGVTFSPTATGSAAGTLTLVDDAATSPQVLNLSGTGR
ncbi:MAG TPA: choice-of-anchor D domain-containing protein [Burkholderiales bacterium]|nr:choice-of-anchor D domain-containing protein [Burkholderiales bacterium]